MFVVIIGIYCRRQLSVMNNDLANRTGHHKYSSDSNDFSDVNNQLRLGTPNSAELSPESIANNPMYVVNFNPGNPDKSINIARQNNIPRRIPPRETGHFYDEPPNTPQNNIPMRIPQRETGHFYDEPPDTQQNNSPMRIPNRETGNVFQEPSGDDLMMELRWE